MSFWPTRRDVEQFGAGLAYVYVVRVPLLLWGICVALPWLALPDEAIGGSLLRGLFDIAQPEAPAFQRFQAFFYVTLAALMTSATIAVTARLILIDGAERFGIVPALAWGPGIELGIRLVVLVAPLSLAGGVWWQSERHAGFGNAWGGTVAGALLFYVAMVWVHPWLWSRAFPAAKRAATKPPKFLALLWRVVRLSPAGFVDPDTHRLRARHAFAVFQFGLSAILYFGLLLGKVRSFGEAPYVPTLCLVLVLLMLACWALSGLSFVFDRHRVPLLALLTFYGAAVSVFPQGDHFYQSFPPTGVPQPVLTAADVLKVRANKPAIVVAAAGGGVQAAAWSARVLAGLHDDSLACRTDFDDALIMISGVSGGSVGAMYIVDSYAGGKMFARSKPPTSGRPDDHEPVDEAEASSLDEITWGLAYPDLLWTVAPFLKGLWLWPPSLVNGNNLTSDRGLALENAWKRTPTLTHDTLNGWRSDFVKSPRERPAVIFNATIAETGERMLLGTTTIEGRAPGRREFRSEYDNRDLQVATAARLSSAFPYVSPPARILRDGAFQSEFHLVDGAYYDNYGTATLLEWLDQGLRASTAVKPSSVMILQIRSSPTTSADQPSGTRGWGFEVAQPVTTLYAVRGAGQLSHSDVDVHLVATEQYTAAVGSAVFEFPERVDGDDRAVSPPLSWHLTPDERRRLRTAWRQMMGPRTVIQSFLKQADVGDCLK